MTNQKIFYEIELPKKETEIAFRLIEISNVLEVDVTRCQHFIPVYNGPGRKKQCPEYAQDTCHFCGLWTCFAHFNHGKRIWIEDTSGFGDNGHGGFHACPCANCEKLPKDDLLKLRALRLEINS